MAKKMTGFFGTSGRSGGAEAWRDAAIGGLAGLAAGGVAASLPGIGPLLAVGPPAAAIGGLVIGAAAGGLMGWMMDRTASGDEAHPKTPPAAPPAS